MSRLLALWGLVLLAGPACKEKGRFRHDEEVKAVVAADRRLAREENEVLSRRGNLQRERAQLRDKRDELVTRRLSLDESDTQGRQALEKEETKLAGLEAGLVQQEMRLNKKLQSLLDEKSDLVEKLAKEGGGGRDLIVSRREYSVAMREKDIGRREAELARREKALAGREQVLAERQAKGCGKITTVVQTVAPPPSGASYSRKDVEPVFKSALAAMQTKGILTADLPPGTDRLVTEVRHSVSQGDYVRGKYAADQLLSTVRKMKIDRGFIGAKIGRLGSAIRSNPPKDKARVTGLFQQATAAYGDGRFVDANRLLNRIYNQLH